MDASSAYNTFQKVVRLYDYTRVTMYDYQREIDRFYDYGVMCHGLNWDICKTTPMDVHSYMETSISVGKKPTSVNRSRDALSSLFKALMVSGDIKHNPVENIRSIRCHPRERPYLDEQHATQFIESIDNPLIQLATRVLYHTGIRISELTTLSKRHFDLDEGILHVIGKGRKQRMIPLHKTELLPYLREYSERILGDADEYALFFQTKMSGKLSDRTVNKVLGEVSRKLETTVPVRCHTWRHSFATRYLYNGGYLHELQYILGHNQIGTTAKYLHANTQAIRFRIEGQREEGMNEQAQ